MRLLSKAATLRSNFDDERAGVRERLESLWRRCAVDWSDGGVEGNSWSDGSACGGGAREARAGSDDSWK